MSTSPFAGVGTAMVTPFRSDGAVDFAKLEEFTEFQIQGGVNFLVPCGTTGESATMDMEEELEIIKTVLRVANGRVPVLAGLGSNRTETVIQSGHEFKRIGITHILSVSPYYNKPNQEGIYQHYKKIKQETGLEICLYNVPGRTGSNVEPDTVARLAEEGIIFSVKEASGSIMQIQKICQLVGDRIQVLSGDDAMTQPLIATGGHGVISVASNALPGPMRQWLDALRAGDFATAREHLRPLLPVFEATFAEPNPIPVKGACSLLGLMELTYRLPLVPPTERTMNLMRQVLQPFGVLEEAA